MEPPEDPNLRAEYSQIEKFLMGESKDFRLPDVTPAQVNLTPLQHDGNTSITGNNIGQTAPQWTSSVNNSPPQGSSDPVAPARRDFSCEKSGSSNNVNLVPAPSYTVVPSQGWNPVPRTPTAAQPNPCQVPVSDLLAHYSNPLQPVMDHMLSGPSSGKPGSQAPGAALAGQLSDLSASVQPAQALSSDVGRYCNGAFPQPAQRANDEGQPSLRNPHPHPQAYSQAAGKEKVGSSVATRFAAAAQGVSQSSNPSAQHLLFNPYGFMTFSTPNSTGFSSSESGYVPENCTHISYDPTAPLGREEDCMMLPMYTGSTFQDLVTMAQRQNSLARQKHQQQEGPVAKNPRGRPRGSRKRRAPAPQQPLADSEAEGREQDRRPYQRRKAEWNSLKMSGAIPGRRQIRSSQAEMVNTRTDSFETRGHGGWECPGMNPSDNGAATNPNNANPGSNQNFSGVETAVRTQAPPVDQLSTQLGNASTSVQASGLDENPSKLWSFRSNPQSTAPLSGQNMSVVKPPSAAAALSKGKQPMEAETQTPIQPANASTTSWVAPPRSGNQISEKSSLGVTNSMTDQTIGELLSFSDVSKKKPGGSCGSRSTGTGTYLQTYMDFTNACFGVTIQERTPSIPVMWLHRSPGSSASSSSSEMMSATSASKDASASDFPPVPAAAKSGDRQQPGSAAAAENGMVVEADTIKNSSVNLAPAASPKPPTSAASSYNQPVSDDLSFNDYFIDVDPMHLADEDYNAGAALKKIFDQPEDSISNVNSAQPAGAQRAATSSSQQQPIPSTGVELPVTALGDFHANSSGQLAEKANSKRKEPNAATITGNNTNNNLQPASMAPDPQPLLNPPAQNRSQAQDGTSCNGISTTVNQLHVQNAHQGYAWPQVPANANHQAAASRSQNADFSLGQTAYYYQNRSQQSDPSAMGPRPYAVSSPPVQHSLPPGPQTRPAMQQQYYPYGRPRGPRRRSRQNVPSAPYPVMDFGHCAVTPTMFNNMVYDGSANSLLGSDLWPGMHQDVFNMTAMADPALPLNPDRLQERVAQLNLGMVSVPNLLPSMKPHPQQALISAPLVANNRMMGNGSMMMNYGPPGMEPYPTSQQGLGAMADAANYNMGRPQMMMKANNIPSFQNYQPPHNLQGQMNPNTQYWHPNSGNWPEYPAAPSSRRSDEQKGQMNTNMRQWPPNFPEYPASSSRRHEEMQQAITMNLPPTVLTSTQENVSRNLPFSIPMASAAPAMPSGSLHEPPTPPSNPQSNPNVAYNPTFGVPYAPKGPHM